MYTNKIHITFLRGNIGFYLNYPYFMSSTSTESNNHYQFDINMISIWFAKSRQCTTSDLTSIFLNKNESKSPQLHKLLIVHLIPEVKGCLDGKVTWSKRELSSYANYWHRSAVSFNIPEMLNSPSAEKFVRLR